MIGFAIERATVPMHESYRDNVDMLYHAFRERVAIGYYTRRGWIADPLTSGQNSPMQDTAPLTHVQTMPLAHPDGPIVILGASYAGGWPLPDIKGRSVTNKGISGQQSFELLARFEQDVVAVRPRAVIVWGFINDIFRSPRQDVDRAKERARESLIALVQQARSAGIEPILLTELTMGQAKSLTERVRSLVGGWLGRPSYQEYVNNHVLDMNAWLRDLARREGLLLLDVQPALSRQAGPRLPEYTSEDGSHVSAAGYEALTRHVMPILEVHLRAR